MAAKSKPDYFMVLWDDEQGVTMPMGWDDDCEGALCAPSGDDSIALFITQKDARIAITISIRYATLRLVQHLPANDDFLGGKKNLRIAPCKINHVKA